MTGETPTRSHPGLRRTEFGEASGLSPYRPYTRRSGLTLMAGHLLPRINFH